VVDSADELKYPEGSNALLKVLEEPPARSLFLIVSHVPGRLLPTIRSRARLMPFRPLTDDQVLQALRAVAPPGADEALMRRAAALSRGSVRQALKVLDEGTLAIVEHIRAALARLPSIDWADIHAIAEGLAGRPNEAAFETMVETVFDWLAEQARERAGEGARRLAPLAEVWDKVARLVRETDSYNLDRRALVLTLFTELSEALRASRAA
jgi:DNA polymerase-3 subunit delta'